MKTFLIAALSLASVAAFGQSTSVEQKIEMRLERLNDLVMHQQAHRRLREDQKRDVLKNINQAIQLVLNDSTPTPTPYPETSVTTCKWFDGVSHGITARGWHAYHTISGVYFSLRYYNNDGIQSQRKCQEDVIFNIDRTFYQPLVSQARADRCTCKWVNDQITGLQRGWHMAYEVPMSDGPKVIMSSKFYDNAGNASEGQCNRELVMNSFICPL